MKSRVLLQNIPNFRKFFAEIARILQSGGNIIIATDTVYGIIADANNTNAIESIYKLKSRPKSKPLQILTTQEIMVKILKIHKNGKELVQNRPKGSTTFVSHIKHHKNYPISKKIYGINGKIGVRTPDDETLLAFLKYYAKPIAATSCNISTEPPATSFAHARKDFTNKIAIICKRTVKLAKPSSVVDISKIANTKGAIEGGSIESKCAIKYAIKILR